MSSSASTNHQNKIDVVQILEDLHPTDFQKHISVYTQLVALYKIALGNEKHTLEMILKVMAMQNTPERSATLRHFEGQLEKDKHLISTVKMAIDKVSQHGRDIETELGFIKSS